MVVFISLIASAIVTGIWLFAVSYLDFQVAQLQRSERQTGLSGRPALILERSLKLPWSFATWLTSAVAVMFLASFCALLHLGLLVLLIFAGAVFLSVMALSDWNRLQSRASGGAVRSSAWLYGIQGEYAGQQVPLEESEVSIGRAKWNTLHLAEPFVSRNHARICCRNGQYYLQDLSSSHGTFLNEQPVDASLLQERDMIRVGSSLFLFSTSAPGSSVSNNSPGAAAAWLDCVHGEHAGYRFPLDNGGLSIGRARESGLLLTEAAVSRQHARICYSHGRFYLQDLGSLHGTLVNGKPIVGSMLNDGDQVFIGGNVFEFHTSRLT